MTSTQKLRFVAAYTNDFVRIGKEFFDREKEECENLYFEKRELFFQQLSQRIDDELVMANYFEVLTMSIFFAHLREVEYGWSWQITINPISPRQQGNLTQTSPVTPSAK
jgi:hypothetical protein